MWLSWQGLPGRCEASTGKPGVEPHAASPAQEVEEREPEIQIHPPAEASVSYMKPCLKTDNKTKKKKIARENLQHF